MFVPFNGVDIVSRDEKILIDLTTRASMVSRLMTQKIMAYRELLANRRTGIEQAKKEGEYTGRKPIKVDENVQD